MSTYTPIPTAPELPTTSMQASSGVQTTANWNYIDKADEDATRVAAKPEAGAHPPADVPQEKNSSTAYAFTGSALGTATSQKLNADSNAAIKDGTESNAANGGTNEEEKNDDSMYECNICLDTAKDAVVSMCGHLFCWPCLHQWLETRPNRKLCPVCKAAISREKVIPLYGRNSSKQEDPRNKVPPRPAGQRTEPEPQQGFQGFGFGDGFHMSFGIGAFPFGYFASSFNFGEARPAAANRGTMQYDDEQQLSKLFLYLAFLCIAWLLFA